MYFFAALFFALFAFATAAPALIANAKRSSGTEKLEFTYYHNEVREEHGANALAWSSDLANMAETWANGCSLAYSDGSLSSDPYGELILATTSDSLTPEDIVNAFISDENEYTTDPPTYNHFTQVVWKSTTQLGCAMNSCPNILDGETATFAVCFYSPPGNIVGEVLENVQA